MTQPGTAAQRIKELDAERSQLLNVAKKEALDRAQAAIADLNALGFSYKLLESGEKSGSATPSRKGTRQTKDASCPICEFKTSPPHDARRHRSQGNRKKPFTSKQLEEQGLVQVT